MGSGSAFNKINNVMAGINNGVAGAAMEVGRTLELIEGMLACRLLLEILVMHQGQLEEMVTFQEILF